MLSFLTPPLLPPSTSPSLRIVRSAPFRASLSDWRTFRARLVQSSQTLSSTTLWAHPTPLLEPGTLLIAHPLHLSSPPSFFTNSIILLISHSSSASIGLILNRPVCDSISDPTLRSKLENNLLPLYLGGPVALDSILALHENPNVKGAVDVISGVVTSPVADVIRRGDSCGRARLFCGYAGWRKGQLEEEIKSGVWICASVSKEIILDGIRIKPLLELLGGEYQQLASLVDDDAGADVCDPPK